VVLHFKAGYQTKQADISQLIHAIGYKIAESTISISSNNDCQEWRLILIATDNHNVLISDVAAVLRSWDFLDGYQVALARN
jgi:putative Mg2+ transporter-C (MgtC) family protein